MAQAYPHDAGPSSRPPDPVVSPRPKPKPAPKWLDAWSDPVANVDATSELMDVADLAGDGDWRLVVCSAEDRKVKVFANARLQSEQTVPDDPIALKTFYASQVQGGARIPSVAVAAGSCVYIYRGASGGLRPYYKFTLPPLPVAPREAEVWRRLANDSIDFAAAREELAEARDAGTALTERSLEFLRGDDHPSGNATGDPALDANASQLRRPLVETRARQSSLSPLVRMTSVVALGALRLDADDVDSVSCLLVCAEDGGVHLLKPDAKVVWRTHQLPSPVACVHASGRAEGEHWIVCACLDGRVRAIGGRGGLTETAASAEGRNLSARLKETAPETLTFDLEAQACGLTRVGNAVVVGCADMTAHAFAISNAITTDDAAGVGSPRNGSRRKDVFAGQKLYQLYFEAPVAAMTAVDVNRQKRFERLVVSLRNGEICVYDETARVMTLFVGATNPCVGMRFGRFGREENALSMVFENGGVAAKILPRRADLTKRGASQEDVRDDARGGVDARDIPLAVPKKTKLYVEQTAREREFGKDVHAAFQKDLCRLRLTAARARVAALRDGLGNFSGSKRNLGGSNSSGNGSGVGHVSVRLDVSVRGLGPYFRILVAAVNVGQIVVFDVPVLFSAHPRRAYAPRSSQVTFPALLPGVRCTCEFGVEATDPQGEAGTIRVYAVDKNSSLPLVSAAVRMPACEFFN